MNPEEYRWHNFGVTDGRNSAANDIREMMLYHLSVVPNVTAINPKHLSITITLEETKEYIEELEKMIVQYVPNQIFPAEERETAQTYSRLREKYALTAWKQVP